uniref:transposase n=1 Tax=Bradyrhizobium mercantei TaxID=1904807 RepID=UPI00373FCE15
MAPARSIPTSCGYGSPEFTNEVQHFRQEVLPWGGLTRSSPWRSDARFARLSASGSSIRQIAAALDRPPSTISRELNRNSGAQVGYKPSYAQQQMRARRWTGSRLEREPGLRRAVLERLGRGWSPEQVAGRLAREHGRRVISYESI